MKFLIINDIHSNYESLVAVVNKIPCMSFDKIIILGDVLTYGVKINETIQLLVELDKLYDCIFIKGNHDQIYFDIQNGKDFEYKPLPKFILEAVKYSANILDFDLFNTFNWVDFYVYENVHFSHANIFEYGDWSYLNTEEDFSRNYKQLELSNLRGAVFGHTHRPKYKTFSSGFFEPIKNIKLDEIKVIRHEKFLITNGSLGQPRNSTSSCLICNVKKDYFDFRSVLIEYDLAKHCDSIFNSDLGHETKEILLSYYR